MAPADPGPGDSIFYLAVLVVSLLLLPMALFVSWVARGLRTLLQAWKKEDVPGECGATAASEKAALRRRSRLAG